MCTLHAGVGLVRLRIFVSGVLYRVVITERTWQKSAAQSPLCPSGAGTNRSSHLFGTPARSNHEPITNVISAPPPPLWSFLVAVQKRWRRQQHWSRAVAQANKPPPVPTSSPRRRYSAASASTRLRHIAASPPPGERHTQRLTPHTLSMPSFMGSAHSKPGASDQF